MESFSLKNRKLIEQTAGVALVAVLVLFCLLVLKPFVSAMLWAAILVFATWPVYGFVKRRLAAGHAVLASGLMTFFATLLLVVPLALLAKSSLDMVAWGLERLQALKETGIPQLVAALEAHPFFGPHADTIRTGLAEVFSDTERLTRWGAGASKVTAAWLVKRGVSLGYGVFQVVFSLIFMFFFYLQGEAMADRAAALMERVGGSFMGRLRNRMALTLNTVVRGTVGTAFVQAVAAAIGFAIFDVPNAGLFAVLVFVLGMLPLGPPLLWIPVGLWLLSNGRMGDGVGVGVGVQAASASMPATAKAPNAA
ncbi:MAG: AI-2E family transporter, partial [Opitutae bacterium]|nr:AI-2E family transporter [Opitutae bacterium]